MEDNDEQNGNNWKSMSTKINSFLMDFYKSDFDLVLSNKTDQKQNCKKSN